MIVIKRIGIKTESIELDKFLKWSGIMPTGGTAKSVIADGQVRVNGQVEIRRSKRLVCGDIVEFEGIEYSVDEEQSESEY